MGEMPENINDWDIRDDQRYLYRMVLAVNSGVCNEQLAEQKPGVISTARWLTSGSSVLRVYVATANPSPTLRNLAEFVVKVYAPFWFLVKSQPKAIHGSRHVFKYICWIRQLPIDVRTIVQSSIKHNAYFFHPENILLSMITDENPFIRADGYNKIDLARQEPPSVLRKFHMPQSKEIIKFDSATYPEMIDWNLFKITEPPCLQFFDYDQLNEYRYENKMIEIPGKYFVTKTFIRELLIY